MDRTMYCSQVREEQGKGGRSGRFCYDSVERSCTRFVLILCACIRLAAAILYAQGSRISRLSSSVGGVSGETKSVVNMGVSIILFGCAIAATIGAARAAHKFWQNDHGSVQSLILWVGGCIATWAMFVIIKAMFL